MMPFIGLHVVFTRPLFTALTPLVTLNVKPFIEGEQTKNIRLGRTVTNNNLSPNGWMADFFPSPSIYYLKDLLRPNFIHSPLICYGCVCLPITHLFLFHSFFPFVITLTFLLFRLTDPSSLPTKEPPPQAIRLLT